MIYSNCEERFNIFHKKFKGDNPEIFKICKKCGGSCEYNKVGTLLPYEKDYIAKKLSIPIKDFSDKYLDILAVNGTELDVLKFVEPCKFLDNKYKCNCRNFKVIMCEIYPIVFSVNNKIRFYLDDNCLITKNKDLVRYWINIGIPAFKSLNIPLNWFRLVEKYDSFNFDYKKIEKLRKSSKCERFDLQLLIEKAIRSNK